MKILEIDMNQTVTIEIMNGVRIKMHQADALRSYPKLFLVETPNVQTVEAPKTLLRTHADCAKMRDDLIARFKVKYPNADLTKVQACSFIFNNQMRTTAGRAHITANFIEMNTRLLSGHLEQFDKTFLHELAHLISYAAFGNVQGAGHGKGWKATMHALGAAPNRTHSMDVKHLKRRHKVAGYASCNCRTKIEIKAVRLSQMKLGRTYSCTLCKARLKLDAAGSL